MLQISSAAANLRIALFVGVSPGAKLIAAGYPDKSVRVFDVSSGHEVARLVHQDPVFAAAFSKDGKLIETVSGTITARLSTLKVFETTSGRELARWRLPGWIDAVDFSPDGKLVATVFNTPSLKAGGAYVLEVSSGRGVAQWEHQSMVSAVAFSPDGKLVAVGAKGDTVIVFESTSGREINQVSAREGTRTPGGPHLHLVQIPEGPIRSRVNDVAFISDDELIIATDNGMRVVEVSKGGEVKQRLPSTAITSLAVNPRGDRFVAQSGNWLHLYERVEGRWHPKSNRHLPGLWSEAYTFVSTSADCPVCVSVVRDVPGNTLEIEHIDFQNYPNYLFKGESQALVSEWSRRLGLIFDSQGRIAPAQPKQRR